MSTGQQLIDPRGYEGDPRMATGGRLAHLRNSVGRYIGDTPRGPNRGHLDPRLWRVAQAARGHAKDGQKAARAVSEAAAIMMSVALQHRRIPLLPEGRLTRLAVSVIFEIECINQPGLAQLAEEICRGKDDLGAKLRAIDNIVRVAEPFLAAREGQMLTEEDLTAIARQAS